MCIGSVHWMWGALMPLTPSPLPGPPPPAWRVPPPRNTWPRHATETHRAHQWEIDRLVDGGGDGESPAHAPRFLYRLGTHGTDGIGIRVKFLYSPAPPSPTVWALVIYEEVVSHIWLCNCSQLNFLIYEENFILFFQCGLWSVFFLYIKYCIIIILNTAQVTCTLRYPCIEKYEYISIQRF